MHPAVFANLAITAFNIFLVILMQIAMAFHYFPNWFFDYTTYWVAGWIVAVVAIWVSVFKAGARP